MLQFSDREIERVETSVRTLPTRKLLRDIGRGVDVGIVEDDRYAVFAQDYVLFEEVGALAVREGLGRERVFRQITARPAMRDDQRTRFRRGEAAEGQEQ